MANKEPQPATSLGRPQPPNVHSSNEGSESPQCSTASASREAPPNLARELELELELARLRSEAVAARLEARASELELILQRLRRANTEASISHPQTLRAELQTLRSQLQATLSESHTTCDSDLVARYLGWGHVRGRGGEPETTPAGPRNKPSPTPKTRRKLDSKPAPDNTPKPAPASESKSNPTDPTTPSSEATPQSRPKAKVASGAQADPRSERVAKTKTSAKSRVNSKSRRSSASQPRPKLPGQRAGNQRRSPSRRTSGKRRKPTAWFASAIVHLLLLLLLAGWTLSTHPPRDQVQLAASSAERAPEPMETFTIETSEPELQQPEETAVEPTMETSPVGEITVPPPIDSAANAPPAPSALADALTDSSAAASGTLANLQSPDSASEATMEFCGVEGGGSHFVYLVDSSGSMGSAFEPARAELLRSISLLRPDQRFYVIFFDEDPDYMRLSDPNQDEPRSVSATPENKQRLARWATGISMNQGRAPYEPLRFAVELRPDVIFLLSDGEFPQRIEQQLRQENRYENLFGESGPICIVHTIGYHSREGESRMRKIALDNGGQYRHIPKP